MKQTNSKAPDPKALAVARMYQEAVAPDTVILFGSRARGDHRPNSDIDLMVVGRSGRTSADAGIRQIACKFFAEHPPPLNIDVVSYSPSDFDYYRRARNHVTAQALRDGTIMSDASFNYPAPHEDHYPVNWPDIRQRLINAVRNLRSMTSLMRLQPDDQEDYGFHAQQAVENTLKGWISAIDHDYRNFPDIAALADVALQNEIEAGCQAGHQLRRLIEYTSFPDPEDPGRIRNWLSLYAVAYRYTGPGYRMDELDRGRFQHEISASVTAAINRVHEITSTDSSDLA